ncbi:TIGR04086 family membrane protein [Anaerosalibacter sp. Marseille-P3206]|uniref:TIGR04086 family membrane protein n=1 Tax=Anaerosalibacter sp. Marseille-P3206 TaxID=1871005 RepID=UPI0009862FE7|nr:TIGR04086 family membrane protein [Anaerosalibacter sp. Marseille-P3206]
MNKKNSMYALFTLKGIALAYIVTFIMMLIFSLLLTFTSLKESMIPILNSIVMIGSIVIASIYLTLKIGEKGWLNGMIIGILYFVILLLLNKFFMKDSNFSIFSFTKLLVSIVTGIIGGMIGINLK